MYKKIELKNSQKQFETKLKQIEKNLEPLINQITSPSSGQFGSNKSLSAQKLVDILNDSIVNFLTASENILNEETSSYLIAEFQIGEELNKFRLSSNQMIQISKMFSTDPSSSDRRLQMIQKARELLSSVSVNFWILSSTKIKSLIYTQVARILAIADLIDLNSIQILSEKIYENLNKMKNSRDQEELMLNFKNYGVNFKELINFTKKAMNVSFF